MTERRQRVEVLTLDGPGRTADATGRLLAEFQWEVDEAEVARIVATCARDLAGSPVGALPELVERSARQRLAHAISARQN